MLAALVLLVAALAGAPWSRPRGEAAHEGRDVRSSVDVAGGGGDPSGVGGARPGARSRLALEPRREAKAVKRFVRLGLPLYCGGRHRPYVALTFDDGPGVYTHLALGYLDRAHVHPTFFLVGRNLPLWPVLPRQELRIGTVGDHTYTHPYLPALSAAEVRQQLAATRNRIAALTGFRTHLFRPPYGALTPAIERQAKALGMLAVLWTVDSADSLGANSHRIAANVLHGLRPGSIILMHENRGQTIVALWRRILPALRHKRLRAVTIPRLLALDPPTLAQLRDGPSGCLRR